MPLPCPRRVLSVLMWTVFGCMLMSPAAHASPVHALSFTAPTAGSTLAGVVSVSGTASSVGVTKVTLRVDNGPEATMTGTSTWTGTLDTLALPNGPHTLTATATDVLGFTSSASIPVSYDNDRVKPTAFIDAPAAFAELASAPAAGWTSFTVSGSARDDRAVRSVDVWLVGNERSRRGEGIQLVGAGTTSATYSGSVHYGNGDLPDGEYQLRVTATDVAGNSSTTSRTVYLGHDDVAPTATVYAPNVNSLTTPTFSITGYASDARGVVSILVAVDGGRWVEPWFNSGAKQTDYTRRFDTAQFAVGTHQATVRVADRAGNVTYAHHTFTIS